MATLTATAPTKAATKRPGAYLVTDQRAQWVDLAGYETPANFYAVWGKDFILTDFENVPQLLAHEYGDLAQLLAYVEALRMSETANRATFAAFINAQDSALDLAEQAPTAEAMVALFEEKYIGYYGGQYGCTDEEAVAAYLQELAEDDEVYNNIPARYRQYIDFNRKAHDAELNRQQYALNGHVFHF
jgi:antirestriction protein